MRIRYNNINKQLNSRKGNVATNCSRLNFLLEDQRKLISALISELCKDCIIAMKLVRRGIRVAKERQNVDDVPRWDRSPRPRGTRGRPRSRSARPCLGASTRNRCGHRRRRCSVASSPSPLDRYRRPSLCRFPQ